MLKKETMLSDCKIYTLNKILYLFLFFAMVYSFTSLTYAQNTNTSVYKLVQLGKLRDLRMGIQEGGWLQGVEAELARAVLNESGVGAFQAFHSLSKRTDLSREAQALVWFNLYSYYLVTNNTAKINQSIDKLNSLQPESSVFFKTEKVPEVQEVKPLVLYALQIGAFGSKANAERLAATNRKKGFKVILHPIKRRSKTLYLVLVGKFGSEAEAKAFGSKNIGTFGKDFHIYKLSED